MRDGTRRTISRRTLMQAGSLVAAQGALARTAAAQPATVKVEDYILQRLAQLKVDVLFGVPGATCAPLFAAAHRMKGMSIVVPASDIAAGQAADAYARCRGAALVSVTYGVGTMGLIAAIAGAYAERSPVVVVNGGPSGEDLRVQNEFGSLFSHSIGHGKTDLALFKEVTASAVRIEAAADAPRLIDAALVAAKVRQRPVYIEVAKDVWSRACAAPAGTLDFSVAPSGREAALAAEIVAKLRAASRPVLLLGIELARYGLPDAARALVEKLQLPWSTTLLAKSVIAEQVAGFVGVYGGENSAPNPTRVIDNADAIVALGCVLGRQYRKLATQNRARLVAIGDGAARVGVKPAQPMSLAALVAALDRAAFTAAPALIVQARLPGLSFDQRRGVPPRAPSAEAGLAYDDVLRAASGMLDETFLAISDTTLAMYPAADLDVAGAGGFLCNSVWQSIGYSLGAALGAGLAQARRPLVLVGDGGFQMNAQAISSLARQNVRAIVVVLDNGLHAIEQWIVARPYFTNPAAPPTDYLALPRWDCAALAASMGFAFTRRVTTQADLALALADARAAPGPALISAGIKPHDLPSGLPVS